MEVSPPRSMLGPRAKEGFRSWGTQWQAENEWPSHFFRQVSSFIPFAFSLVTLIVALWRQFAGTIPPFTYVPSVRRECRLSGCAGWGSPSSSRASARSSPAHFLWLSLLFLLPMCCSQDEEELVPWKEFYFSLAVCQDELEKEATSERRLLPPLGYLQHRWVRALVSMRLLQKLRDS